MARDSKPSRRLPALFGGKAVPAARPAAYRLGAKDGATPQRPKGIPNATLIYGLAAAAMAVISVYTLIQGHWLNGALLLVMAAALFGYAMYYMRHQS